MEEKKSGGKKRKKCREWRIKKEGKKEGKKKEKRRRKCYHNCRVTNCNPNLKEMSYKPNKPNIINL